MNLKDVIHYLKNYPKRIKIMEVCGTHTASIVKSGIKDMISAEIRLVSGPGCPVCVTSSSYIDVLTEHAFKPGHTVLSFGDMLRVRGSEYSLLEARALGADVRLVYSPLEAIRLAKENPGKLYIIAAVGFETTTPIYAVLMDELVKNGIDNVRLLTSLKTMPPALAYICENEEIDAFLCPGHVSVIIGSNAYNTLCERYKKPFVIAGFEPEHILGGIYQIVYQAEKKLCRVENLYASAVSAEGQGKAKDLVARYFTASNAFWRGIGEIKGSGMLLKDEFRKYDLGSKNICPDHLDSGCMCGDVILGRANPDQCRLFSTICNPSNPVGACMVSSEGACGVWYENIKTGC